MPIDFPQRGSAQGEYLSRRFAEQLHPSFLRHNPGLLKGADRFKEELISPGQPIAYPFPFEEFAAEHPSNPIEITPRVVTAPDESSSGPSASAGSSAASSADSSAASSSASSASSSSGGGGSGGGGGSDSSSSVVPPPGGSSSSSGGSLGSEPDGDTACFGITVAPAAWRLGFPGGGCDSPYSDDVSVSFCSLPQCCTIEWHFDFTYELKYSQCSADMDYGDSDCAAAGGSSTTKTAVYTANVTIVASVVIGQIGLVDADWRGVQAGDNDPFDNRNYIAVYIAEDEGCTGGLTGNIRVRIEEFSVRLTATNTPGGGVNDFDITTTDTKYISGCYSPGYGSSSGDDSLPVDDYFDVLWRYRLSGNLGYEYCGFGPPGDPTDTGEGNSYRGYIQNILWGVWQDLAPVPDFVPDVEGNQGIIHPLYNAIRCLLAIGSVLGDPDPSDGCSYRQGDTGEECDYYVAVDVSWTCESLTATKYIQSNSYLGIYDVNGGFFWLDFSSGCVNSETVFTMTCLSTISTGYPSPCGEPAVWDRYDNDAGCIPL